MTEEQRDRLDRIADPYAREVLRRLFERVGDPLDRVTAAEQSTPAERRQRREERKAADAAYREARADRQRERRERR